MAYLLRLDRSSTVTKSGSITTPDSLADGTTSSSDRFEVVGTQLAPGCCQQTVKEASWPLAARQIPLWKAGVRSREGR